MKKINKLFASVLLLIGFAYLIKFSIAKELTRVLVSLCIPILIILPKFIKNKVNDKIVFIYYLYIFILMILGCLAKFYSKLEYYDVFTHFIFGFAGCIVGLYLLNLFDIHDKNIVFNIIFMVSCTLTLSSLWEIFEYIASIIFNEDVQNVLATGVSDTMEDIIASFIASILFTVVYALKKDKINSIVKCQ